MSTTNALPPTGLLGGGLPPVLPRDAQITVVTRTGNQVATATWPVCVGVADFITRLLGEPRDS